jgi:hypothetical protein
MSSAVKRHRWYVVGAWLVAPVAANAFTRRCSARTAWGVTFAVVLFVVSLIAVLLSRSSAPAPAGGDLLEVQLNCSTRDRSWV